MKNYKATISFSTRERLTVRFESPDDESAIRHAEALSFRDWHTQGVYFHDNDDLDVENDGVLDVLEYGQLSGETINYACESKPMPRSRPYSWDAQDLAKEIANIDDTDLVTSDDVVQKLQEIRIKARTICGRD